jgi:hypothetical protein
MTAQKELLKNKNSAAEDKLANPTIATKWAAQT